jgi:hypothetical protein
LYADLYNLDVTPGPDVGLVEAWLAFGWLVRQGLGHKGFRLKYSTLLVWVRYCIELSTKLL